MSKSVSLKILGLKLVKLECIIILLKKARNELDEARGLPLVTSTARDFHKTTKCFKKSLFTGIYSNKSYISFLILMKQYFEVHLNQPNLYELVI